MKDSAGQIDSSSAAARIPIVTTKLHRPAISPDVLPRDRLTNQLITDLQRPFTLISAPAGYGKSTLASRWLESVDYLSVWVSLDENDNDLGIFVNYLVAGVCQIFPGSLQPTRKLLNAPVLAPRSVLSMSLLNDLDVLEQRFFLVLDDYHFIHREEIHDFLTDLLRHPPKSMHLALLSRRDPPLPLTRLRANGQMTEIAMDELRFTDSETEEFLSGLLQTRLEPTAIAHLNDITEGWVTGLRLAGLSLRNQENRQRILKEMKGGFHNIGQYFVQEVLSQLPEEIALYLMETSILDRFCSPLCEAVHSAVEVEDSDAKFEGFIQWLEKANLFVIPMDLEHRWFRYHHLFQELLQAQLRRRYRSEEIASLHSRVSRWFVENGFLEEGIKHALKAGDIVGAAEIIERHRHDEFTADRWYVLDRWMSMLPKDIKEERIELLLAEAWLAYTRVQMERIPPIIERVESLLQKEEVDPRVTGELFFFKGTICYFDGRAEKSLHYIEKALLERAGGESHVESNTEFMLGLARCKAGKKEVAIQALEDRIQGPDSPNGQFLTHLIGGLFFVHLLSGDLPRAIAAGEQMELESKKNHIIVSETWGEYFQGCAQLHNGNLDQALYHFSFVAEHRYFLNTGAVIDGLAGLALTNQLLHQSDAAADSLDLLLEFAQEMSTLQYLDLAHSCRARLAVLKGELKSVSHWVHSVGGTPTPGELFIWLEVPYITQARVLIAMGTKNSLGKAVERLREIRRQSEGWRYMNQTIEVAVLQSLALQIQGHKNEAVNALEDALNLAKPGGWIRPFIEAGPVMAEMLQSMDRIGKDQVFTQQILTAFEKPVQTTTKQPIQTDSDEIQQTGTERIIPSSSTDPTSLDALTNRELDILELLARRLQNKEISEKLFISTHTVNYHLKHIYDKLGVHGRRQAVDRAFERGIIKRIG